MYNLKDAINEGAKNIEEMNKDTYARFVSDDTILVRLYEFFKLFKDGVATFEMFNFQNNTKSLYYITQEQFNVIYRNRF